MQVERFLHLGMHQVRIPTAHKFFSSLEFADFAFVMNLTYCSSPIGRDFQIAMLRVDMRNFRFGYHIRCDRTQLGARLPHELIGHDIGHRGDVLEVFQLPPLRTSPGFIVFHRISQLPLDVGMPVPVACAVALGDAVGHIAGLLGDGAWMSPNRKFWIVGLPHQIGCRLTTLGYYSRQTHNFVRVRVGFAAARAGRCRYARLITGPGGPLARSAALVRILDEVFCKSSSAASRRSRNHRALDRPASAANGHRCRRHAWWLFPRQIAGGR